MPGVVTDDGVDVIVRLNDYSHNSRGSEYSITVTVRVMHCAP